MKEFETIEEFYEFKNNIMEKAIKEKYFSKHYKKKLKLKNWVKVALFYIGIAILTILTTLRIEELSNLGF